MSLYRIFYLSLLLLLVSMPPAKASEIYLLTGFMVQLNDEFIVNDQYGEYYPDTTANVFLERSFSSDSIYAESKAKIVDFHSFGNYIYADVAPNFNEIYGDGSLFVTYSMAETSDTFTFYVDNPNITSGYIITTWTSDSYFPEDFYYPYAFYISNTINTSSGSVIDGFNVNQYPLTWKTILPITYNEPFEYISTVMMTAFLSDGIIEGDSYNTSHLSGIEFTDQNFNDISGFRFIADSGNSYPIQNVNPVPEPSTFILLGAGLAGLAAMGIRRKKS